MWPIGSVTISPAAATLLAEAGVHVESVLARYRAGDWGEQDEYHASFCTFAVAQGLPVLSRYALPGGASVALGTSADRTETRVLTLDETLPDLAAVANAGLSVRAVDDIPVREMPAQVSHPGLVAQFGDVPFCLVIHAVR